MTAFPGSFVYQAAKAAIIMITKGAALDYAAIGIRCNAVCPGFVATPRFYAGLPTEPDARARVLERQARLAPLGRVGVPAEIARVVMCLLSESASFITGAGIVVDGGASVRCYEFPAILTPEDISQDG